MERNLIEIELNQANACAINSQVVFDVIRQCCLIGISEFCICPGGRNTAFLDCLEHYKHLNLKTYFFYEERSATFFALGRARALEKPVAIITTSGTAVAELLPATMEAFYTEIPLLLITADRPKRFWGSGAPQTAQQEGIFGIYTPYSQSIEYHTAYDLGEWNLQTPAHLNVCLEEAYEHNFSEFPHFLEIGNNIRPYETIEYSFTKLSEFLKNSKNPIVLVGALLQKDCENVVEFLHKLNLPVYCEGVSGIRECPQLESIRLKCPHLLSLDSIDGVIRIGGIPTLRLWRDLEENRIPVISISHLPYSGLSWADVLYVDISSYLSRFNVSPMSTSPIALYDHIIWFKLERLLQESSFSEQSFFYQITKFIPEKSNIYLGNSLSIRQWDLYAPHHDKEYRIFASRGLNGIDGQISTFLGLCDAQKSNWAILGDLTALYDLAGPWIIDQLEAKNVHLVIVNNGGGKIFSKLFKNPKVQNNHAITFEHFAKLWKLNHYLWPDMPQDLSIPSVIEFIPDEQATDKFHQKIKEL